MNSLRNLPKAELTLLVTLALLIVDRFHGMHVISELDLPQISTDKITALDVLLGNRTEGLLWVIGMTLGYVVGKRATSKPEVIRAEADARIAGAGES